MNKSRRMLARQGRLLSDNGVSFLLPDLFGTGDSDGDFQQATWERWRDDILFAVDWLHRRGHRRLDFLAMRSGCLLLKSVLELLDEPIGRVAMWAPVIGGQKMLTQLFRTMLVSNKNGSNVQSIADVRDEIRDAGKLEIAGYVLSSVLVDALDIQTLDDLRWSPGQRVLWMDASPTSGGRVPPVTQKLLDAWQPYDAAVEYHRVQGPQFWMGPEIEEVPEFLSMTTEFLS